VFDIIGRRAWWYLLSTCLIVPGVIGLLTGGLSAGIDFTGGSLLQMRFAQAATQDGVDRAVRALGYDEAVVQTTQEGAVLIRLRALEPEQKTALVNGLVERLGAGEELGFSAIGPVVGAELTRGAIVAVAAASALILLYITWAFRRMEHPVRYGAAAVIALVHDSLFLLGLFALLGRFGGVQIDALFVTAVLTVIGFSVNDTIVVFDRIRENRRAQVVLPEATRPSYVATVNYSVNQSLTRSINTSLTAIFVLLALLLLGGATLRDFVLALTVGFIVGTYSSVFNAACLVVSWEQGDLPRAWGWLRGRMALRRR